MTEKSEALRLADALEVDKWHISGVTAQSAAEELRRLHGLDFALRDCELALQKMATKYMDAVDQRDALLEALKDVLRYVSPVADGAINARAAIARAEGEKT
jgi:hypothetical protein